MKTYSPSMFERPIMRRIVTLLLVFISLVLVCAPCVQTHPAPKELHDCDAGSCALHDAAVAGESTVIGERKVFSQENWKFSVPGLGWETYTSPDPTIKKVVRNQGQNCLTLFIKEETTDSFGRYVIGIIRSFAESGDTVSAIKQVTINGQPFVEIQTNTREATVWVWIAVKDGFGYGLSCGGKRNPDAGSALHDLCQNIADTVEVK